MGFCVCDHLTMNLLNLSLYDLLALSKPLTLSLPLSGTQPSSTPRLETNLSLPIPAWNPSSQAQCLGCDHQAPWGGGGLGLAWVLLPLPWLFYHPLHQFPSL